MSLPVRSGYRTHRRHSLVQCRRIPRVFLEDHHVRLPRVPRRRQPILLPDHGGIRHEWRRGQVLLSRFLHLSTRQCTECHVRRCIHRLVDDLRLHARLVVNRLRYLVLERPAVVSFLNGGFVQPDRRSLVRRTRRGHEDRHRRRGGTRRPSHLRPDIRRLFLLQEETKETTSARPSSGDIAPGVRSARTFRVGFGPDTDATSV